MGELFGSLLGKSIGNGNPLAEIAAGTLLGLTLSKVGSALEAAFSGDVAALVGDATRQSSAELGQQLGGLSPDIVGRLQGVGSSLLAAELADALGLQGFQGQIFTAAAGGVTSQFIKSAVSLMKTNSFSVANLFTDVGANAADMAGSIQGSFGSVFGSYLGSKIVTPETPEAAVFASVGSAIGSVIGTAAVAGTALSLIPFVGPFIGAFLGQVLVGWAANAVEDNDDLAGVTLGVDYLTGRVASTSERVWDKGDITLARHIGNGVVATVNDLLDKTGMHLDVERPFAVEVGYYTDTRDWQYAFAGTHQEFYSSGHGRNDQALAGVAQSAIDQVTSAMTLIGGDILMRRAFYASRAGSTGDDGFARLGFDLQVAKDYRFYLDHEGAIKALIKAEPTSAFSAGWIATLARVSELGLNRGSTFDFKSGFYANLKDLDAVQGPHGAGGGFAPERLAWIPDLDPHDLASRTMLSGSLILRSPDGSSTVTAEDIFGPGGVAVGLGTNGGSQTVDMRGYYDPSASVVLVRAFDGDKQVFGPSNQGAIIVGGSGVQTLVGGNGNDWIRSGNGNAALYGGAGDDLLVAGIGNPLLDGGRGRPSVPLRTVFIIRSATLWCICATGSGHVSRRRPLPFTGTRAAAKQGRQDGRRSARGSVPMKPSRRTMIGWLLAAPRLTSGRPAAGVR